MSLKPADLIREYGAAIRGDWGCLDGRSVRIDLDSIATWVEIGEAPDDARERLDICPNGHGHWTEHCRDDCTTEVEP